MGPPEQREPPPAEELNALNAMLAEMKKAQAIYATFPQEKARASLTR